MGASEYPTFKKAVSYLSYSERLDTALKIALVNVRNTGMFGQNMHATNCLIIHCIEDAYNSLVAIAEAAPRQAEGRTVIYYVIVTPKLITECRYRIAAPDARTAEKAGIDLFLEDLKHSSLTMSVTSEKDFDQDSEPDFFAHKEDQE